MAGADEGGCASAAAAVPRPLPTAVYTSSLWLLDSADQQCDDGSPLRQPMKSLATAAAEAAAAAAACERDSPAHLFAPRQASSQDLCIRASWASAKEPLVTASSSGSPRIAAVPPPFASIHSEDDRDALGMGALGSLLRHLSSSLSDQLQFIPAALGISSEPTAADESVGSGAAEAAIPAAAAAAAPTDPAAAAHWQTVASLDGELALEFCTAPEADADATGCNGTPTPACDAHISPAHLIAHAPGAWALRPSPAAEAGATAEGATADAAVAAAGTGSDSRSPAGEPRDQLPRAPLLLQRLLQEVFEDEKGQQQQQLAQEEEQQQQLAQDEDGQQQQQQQEHVLPTAQPQQATQVTAAQTEPPLLPAAAVAVALAEPPAPPAAAAAVQAEPSVLSSPSSGCYSPEVAAGRYLDTKGAMARADAAADGSSGGGTSAGWQRARKEGGVRRSLAHPIFGLQPPRDEEQEEQRQQRRQGRGVIAGLTALLAASQRQFQAACSPPAPAREWTVASSHIQIDLLSDGGNARPAPLAPGGDWQQEQQGQEQQGQGAAYAEQGGAGQYAALFRQFEQLKLTRVRRAVRASLKRDKQAEAPSLAAAPAPTLLRRVLRGCLRKADTSRSLRRALKHQRVHLLCLGRVPYNPDEPLHFELWQAVCCGFAGLSGNRGSLHADACLAAWQVLGFSAANPAAELGDTGVLALLFLLLLADCTPQLAACLAEASPLGVPLAAAAVEATTWTLRLLRCGELAAPSQQLGSTSAAAEAFFLGAVDCCLQELLGASPEVQRLPQPRMALALLSLGEERACGDAEATVRIGQHQLAGA